MDPIKAKIQELCPDINLGGFRDAELKQPRYADITLAVVLRAIGKRAEGMKVSEAIMRDGNPAHPIHWRDEKWLDTVWKWNLTKDNYDDQTEETKRFIGNLLGV